MKFRRVAYIAISLLLGILILVVSVARAGLEIMAAGESGDSLRNDPIKFALVEEDGEKNEYLYRLPEPGLLPTNPFYGFKKIRDFLWVKFSGEGVKRARVELLMADKRMAEAKMLLEDNKTDFSLRTSQEALDALKSAETSIFRIREETEESKQISSQIFEAGFAYMTILKDSENSFEMDVEKYNQLIKELDEWNQEQKTQAEEDN